MNYVSLDALNEAKKRINYLMKVKYNDPVTEYNETDDTNADEVFQKVISGVKSGSEILYQLVSLVSKTNNNVLYYKNISTFVSFQQNLLKLVNVLKSVNQTILSLNNQFGYVEPNNMSQFINNMTEFDIAFNQYEGLTRNHKISVRKQAGALVEEDTNLEAFNAQLFNEVKNYMNTKRPLMQHTIIKVPMYN